MPRRPWALRRLRHSSPRYAAISVSVVQLGDRWLRPDLFRFGASALLADIERQLEFAATGRYSALHRHPLA